MELSGKRILIIGLGKTGIAAVRFLARRGAEIVVTDEKPLSLLKEAFDELADVLPHFKFRAGGLAIGSDIDLVVPSPGVAPLHEILSEAVNRGIPVMSELELACRFLRRPMIAITGTNGKTTTTTLIGEILEGAGKKVFVGGNIGRPLIGYVDGKQEEEYVVIEVSSFQLQWSEYFRPAVAVLLNTTCDHVNYHGSFAAYRQVKERIFANQTREQRAIINAAEPSSRLLAPQLAALLNRKLNYLVAVNVELLFRIRKSKAYAHACGPSSFGPPSRTLLRTRTLFIIPVDILTIDILFYWEL